MRISSLIISILICFAHIAYAEKEYERNVDKWSVVTPPPRSEWKKYYDFLHLANYSNHNWVVRRENGKVFAYLTGDYKLKPSGSPPFDTTVKLQDSKAPAYLFAKVDDGWIAAYNMGEFGSAVYWFNENGKKKRKLSNHQVNEFLFDQKRIFAVEGLAHLGLSRGSMIELRKERDKWISEQFIPLPGSAEAIAKVSSGNYVIVTSDMLLRVNLKKEVNILIPNGNWGTLYPNSVAIDDDGFIFIGMRQFVARCKLGKGVQSFEFIIPDTSWLNKSKK
jgi:hypothetical protein